MSGFEVRAIVEEGARRAGAPAPSDAEWCGALDLLVASAREEGGLSPAGAEAFRKKLTALVAERLMAEAWFAREPAIRARPLPVRFVVAGLARSGTTFLHRLLSCDPDVEFLPTWQAFRPVPPLAGADTRREEVVAQVDAMRAASPESFTIHPVEADAPEEEVFLLQHSFASMLFALSCPLPRYNAWLNATDHRDAYRFAFDLLRLNEHVAGRPTGRPRVMKSPQFVLDLAVATELVPDAVFVQNHRDPVDLVGSYCSTYANSRRRSCAVVDPIATGRERLGQLAAMAARARAVRAAADAAGRGDRFVDVHYERLVAEPLAVVEEVYAAAGLPITAHARQAMERWLAEHHHGGAGGHRYSLDEFGLDAATVHAALDNGGGRP